MKQRWRYWVLYFFTAAVNADVQLLRLDYQSDLDKGMQFRVVVSESGRVSFDGYQRVKHFGHHQYQLTLAQREELTRLLATAWLVQLPDRVTAAKQCASLQADRPTIIWKIGAQVIRHALGCQGFAQQSQLQEWEQQVYDVLALNHWVGLAELHGQPHQPPIPAFTLLLHYYQQHSFGAAAELNVGANASQLASLQQAIGQALPLALRHLLAFSNGQEPTSMGLMLDGYYLLSSEEIAFEYQTLLQIYQRSAISRQIDRQNGEVLGTWWHPQWIPFASMGNGDLLMLDLNPGDHGQVGQVIEFIHDDYERTVLAASLQAYFVMVRQGLKSGDYVLTEFGVMRRQDAGEVSQ